MGVYLFYGDENYLIDKELEKFRSKLDKNFSEMNYAVYDKLTYTDLIAILRTQPMMFGNMMIVINTRKLFGSSVRAESLFNATFDDNQLKEIEMALEGNIQNNNETVNIFFVERYSENDKTKKPDSRKKIFKILSKYNSMEFMRIPDYKTAELGAIISKMAKDKKLKVAQDAIDALIESKGNDLRAFDTELDKLGVYAHPETLITKKMVEDICTSKEDLFKLIDYIVEGKKSSAILELHKLLDTKHPLEIISPLQTFLKQYIFIKLNLGKMSNKDIGMKLGRMTEGRVFVLAKKVKNISAKSLISIKSNVTEAEYRIKTGQAYSPEEELENAIIR